MQKWVKVKPNSRQVKIVEDDEGNLTIWLKSPPVDGKANTELIKILAERFAVTKKSIQIRSGLNSRQKLVDIEVDDPK